ncbi:type ISP restriction/modification enzyme [Bifidobacterium sp. AGR2158]|uniref:type ISP restriction/modification enzyme n=1 Tax=Bifidobacterium sp. AGR2158 TaxID=1280675 RepID=UPI0003FFEDC8|nr:type ISP restriction/modification enzyme [Bifidobacterium sp. AGR2158]
MAAEYREDGDRSFVEDLFARIVDESVDTRQQGTWFEYTVKWFLENDPSWVERITEVWMWDDAPEALRRGHTDTGIDLVALDVDGSYWAIQAKCYRGKKLNQDKLASFFMNATDNPLYGHFMIADTASGYTSTLESFITQSPKDIVRLDLDTMKDSNLDWHAFLRGEKPNERETFDPRPHQVEAIEAVRKELDEHDRCTLVMACGTGKTLTALRYAEQVPGMGGTVLFLAPSISLVSQTMRNWVNQVRGRINLYVCCSSPKASHTTAESYGQLSDIPFPATTNAQTIANRFKPKKDALNVIFSTYQSIDVIHEAQELGLCDFDLIVCDEAHRTTGTMDDDVSFRKVHSNKNVRGDKRLYMTATPRIYGEDAKNKAKAGAVEIASMDNVDVYGRVAYTLSFGKAVQLGLLTDYKIVVMQVAEDQMSRMMQERYSEAKSQIPLSDAAKFVGCWKALFDRRHASNLNGVVGRHAQAGLEDDESRQVLHHAIAFASTIKDSERLKDKFQAVIDDYTSSLEDTEENRETISNGRMVKVEIDHVDGTMDAEERREKLDWLAEDMPSNECHILSNARCLAEGVDVPDLDAVIYLHARKSHVDIIQSVGRVMRKAPGKQFGYIIVPVVVPLGADPDSILSSSNYKIVWDVVRALRSHDERLEAVINAASLGDTEALKRIVEVDVLHADQLKLKGKHRHSGQLDQSNGDGERNSIGSEDLDNSGVKSSHNQGQAVQPEFTGTADEWAKAINAQIVRRCGTKIYWGEWTQDIANIAAARAQQIDELVQHGKAKEAFEEYVRGLRDSLNPDYSEVQAITVLAQHEITKPIFETLFTEHAVINNNPVMKALDTVMDELYAAGLPSSITDPTLLSLYDSVKIAAAQITTDTAKQNLIKEIYNEFFTKVFKDTANELGIVYTPVEVVDAQLHMVQRALAREFGQQLGDHGVHVLDGFAGTGTYICRLIEDPSLIADDQLEYKYMHDLHSNEIVPLAATIMDINIEQSYHLRHGGDYVNFPGALLTDTFQMSEKDDEIPHELAFEENTRRACEQLKTPIRVIAGNPPYRANDKDNTGNQNTEYKYLDARIGETYVAKSDATLNNSLYDHYIRAFRWASDRILKDGNDSGVICFVSNGGWLTSSAGAGVRRSFIEEFNSIYVYNLRGNQRTQGEESRKEGGKIFDSGSRATIAITMLVKNPNSDEHGVIHYKDIGDYLSRDEKLDILKQAVDEDPEWTILTPDEHGDWLNQRDDSYQDFVPLGLGKYKHSLGLFETYSGGLKTQRDAWAINFSLSLVVNNMRKLIDSTNIASDSFVASNIPLPQDFAQFSWTRRVRDYAESGFRIPVNFDGFTAEVYRPFCKEYVYFDKYMNERTLQQPRIFPLAEASGRKDAPTTPSSSSLLQIEKNENSANEMTLQQYYTPCFENKVITVGERGAIMSNLLPDLEFNHHGQCFPLYWYEQVEVDVPADDAQGALFDDPNAPKAEQTMLDLCDGATQKRTEYVRHDAITDTGLQVFRAAYPGMRISKEDIFYYVYGVLHSPEYRKRFENNLSKELPRIPLAKDFKAFMKAGRELAQLHLDYEHVEPYPVVEVGDRTNPGRTEKMRYPNKIKDPESGKKIKDPTVLQVAERLTFQEIPTRAYQYVVNGKSALDWIIDRYQVRVDKKTGIVNDPNLYSDDPRYIVDLVRKVITVSLRTLDIVESLPPLEELPQPANWPAEWK